MTSEEGSIMGLLDSLKKKNNVTTAPAPTTSTPPASGGGLLTTKKTITQGQSALLVRKQASGDEFTLIAAWGQKDYDLYALVEYVDGHVEVVSCFGTVKHPKRFSLKTEDGAVSHVSGDKTAYGQDLPQEVIAIKVTPKMRTIVPVVYSAKNSGTGSFHRYGVSTYVIRGNHSVVPTNDSAEMIAVDAVNANRDDNVYTFVPAVIHISAEGARIEAVELYSRRGSELRPTVKNGKVSMDSGEENSDK
jgi:hypothetical protein